ncbi:hypothetical protein BaRGS_00002954, partial [Batillaria attramentaria]
VVFKSALSHTQPGLRRAPSAVDAPVSDANAGVCGGFRMVAGVQFTARHCHCQLAKESSLWERDCRTPHDVQSL